MNKLSLEQIKKRFEHRDYSERMDFINEYHFKDDYEKYYLNFIKLNIDKIKDPHYYSEIIDLCGFLNFDTPFLYNKIFNYLTEANNFFIKLAVFDYLVRVNRFYKDKKAEIKILNFIRDSKKIVRSGRSFLLFMAYKSLVELKEHQKDYIESKNYFLHFKELLINEKNSAMAWRAYKSFKEVKALKRYRKEVIKIVRRENEVNKWNHIL